MFFKKIIERLKNPTFRWLIIFYALFLITLSVTFALLFYVKKQTAFHYIFYSLSALSLFYFIYTIIYYAPIVKKIIAEHKLKERILSSIKLKKFISFILPLMFNIIYLIFLLVLYIITGSYWYLSLTLYYFILSFLRAGIMLVERYDENGSHSLNIFLLTGMMLIILPLSYFFALLVTVHNEDPFEFSGFLLYAFAVYTFCKFILSLITAARANAKNDFYQKAIKNVNFACALISFSVLQVAMFKNFANGYDISGYNLLTGAILCGLVAVMGIIIIIDSIKQIKTVRRLRKLNAESPTPESIRDEVDVI